MKVTSGRLLIAALTASMALSGCSGSGSGSAGSSGSNAVVTNIKGQVGGSGGGGFFARFQRRLIGHQRSPSASSVVGCTISAYSITGNTVLATVQSTSGGEYTLTGANLTPGVQYKIVADCSAVGGNIVSAVQGADSTDPTTKPAAPVNSTTTLIATEIVQAIVSAVQSATKGLNATVATAIQNSILTPQVMSNIVSVVSTTVQTAIDNGTMQPPSDDSASNMAGAIVDTTSTTSLDGNGNIPAVGDYQSTDSSSTTLPPVLKSAVSSLSSQAAAFPGCQSSLNTDQSLPSHVDQYGQPLASLHKCQIAVAKMLNSVVHFDVAVLMTGGAFDDYYVGAAGSPTHGIGTCLASDPVLSDAFPNATFTLSQGASAKFDDGGQYCIIHNSTPVVDRDSSPNNYGDNGGGGLLTGETGPNGAFFQNGGLISALGASLWNNGGANGLVYHIPDIDKIVFTPSASVTANVGMDARLAYIAQSYTWDAPQQNSNYNPLSSSLSLLTVSGGATALASWPQCTGSPCADPGQSNGSYTFTNNLWVSSTNSAAATAIGASSWVGSVFYNKFGGVVPDEQTLTQNLINGTTHNENNRTGNSTFYVLYKYQPSWNDPACQYSSANTVAPTGSLTISGTWSNHANSLSLDNSVDASTLNAGQSISGTGIPTGTVITNVDVYNKIVQISAQTSAAEVSSTSLTVSKSTKCIAYDAVNTHQWYVQPLVTVNLHMSAADTNGYRHIDKIETPTSGSGQYYVMPVMTGGPFQGLVQFVDATSGNVLLDDNLNQRFVQIIFDQSNQCNQAGIPTHGSGNCNDQDMFNVSVSWKCSNGQPCVATLGQMSPGQAETKINSGSADAGNQFYAFNLSYQVNQTFSSNGPGLVAAAFKPSGNNAGSNNFAAVAATIDPSTGEITTGSLVSGALGAHQYNIQQYYDCSTPGQPCLVTGYVLVDGSGNYYQGTDSAGAYSGSYSSDVSLGTSCNMSGCANNVLVYKQVYFDTDIAAVQWPWADGGAAGSDTFRRVAEQPLVNMGPAANPNWDCSLDPYFLDVNGNGQIDVDINGVCLEPTFSNVWQAGQWLNPGSGPNPSPFPYSNSNYPGVPAMDQAAAKAKMKANPSNSYVYGDPKSASALLHLAFGPMLDGKHTLDSSTNLNALQVFGLIYMYFTGGNNNGSNIPGIYTAAGSTNMFETETPACNGNTDDVCNAAIAGGISSFGH